MGLSRNRIRERVNHDLPIRFSGESIAAHGGLELIRRDRPASRSRCRCGSGSGCKSISGDGRYVLFASDASNLVAGDTNETADIVASPEPSRLLLQLSALAVLVRLARRSERSRSDAVCMADSRRLSWVGRTRIAVVPRRSHRPPPSGRGDDRRDRPRESTLTISDQSTPVEAASKHSSGSYPCGASKRNTRCIGGT
ncbi:MAG: hypothetical protein H6Q91_91 [Deltaproteobacteria bacterium]|nr:hypothetical protein [Deltaproteobacteria bacterium]